MPDTHDFEGTNEGWFKRHVIANLEELRQGQRDVVISHKEMHKENQRLLEDLAATISTHEEADQNMFASIRNDLGTVKQEVRELQPVKTIVYRTVALILLAFFMGLLVLVWKK